MRYGPVYEQLVARFNQPGNHTPGNEMTFLDIDDAIARGPVLGGRPQQIIDQIMYFHEAFGRDPQSLSLPTMLPHEAQLEMLERLAAEVIPVVRGQVPTTLWTEQDPYGGRPAFAAAPSPTPPRSSRRVRLTQHPLRTIECVRLNGSEIPLHGPAVRGKAGRAGSRPPRMPQ